MRALGMMSGTSMDGVDAAVIETDGMDAISYGATASLRYPREVRETLLAARGWGQVPEAEALVLEWHGARLRPRFDRPEVVGFHGQTVAHDPEGGRTRQLGDGAALARTWGTTVVWDFRSEDMRQGGQGAPLAPFFHFHALRAAGLTGRVAWLNLGGVGNVSWLDLSRERAEAEGAILAFDTGPANAPMDDAIRAATGQGHDEDGALAARGTVDRAAVAAFLARPFFAAPPPKSLDRDSLLPDLPAEMSLEDRLATLTAASAASVAAAARHFPAPVERWIVSGGGRRNPVLMQHIREAVSAPVEPVESLGLDGDMIEAQAFAWLAVRVLKGLPTSAPGTTGCVRPICGGRISVP